MHYSVGGRWLLTPFSIDITIKVEDPDCLSSSSYRDVESERFLSSSSSTARRVSFNEAALFDQGKKTQEKGRR